MIKLIFLKEIKSYFKSPLPYILAGLYSLISGWIFFNLLVNFVDNIQNFPGAMNGQISFVDAVVFKLFGNLNFLLLFMSPLLTMRLFAEEKKNRTLDLYYSTPVKEIQIVMGKYLASLCVMFFMIGLTMIFPIIMNLANLQNFNVVVSGYIGLMLNSLCYLSLGIFASSLTENQIIAALISAVGVLGLWMISWGSQITNNFIVAKILKYISIVSHFEFFVKGIINSADVIYYATFIIFFLFLTKKVLESRDW